MYNISSDYQNYINSSIFREPKTKVVVDGTEYNGVVIKSFPQISYESTSFIGGFPAKTCKFEIFNLTDSIDLVGKEVTVYCGLNLGATTEYIPMGIFKAKNDKITSNKTSKVITFEGTDRTQLFDKAYSSELVWTSSHTGLEIIQEICTSLGVTLETSNFSFASYVFAASPNFPTGITYREVISRMAEIGGEIAFISRTGGLVFKKPTATGITIAKSKYKTLKKEKQFGAITRVVLGHNGYDDDIVYGTAGVDLRIEDNPFVDLIREDIISTVANNIIGMSIIPFQLENTIEDYYLDLNDSITIQNKDGTYFTSTILAYSSSGRIKANIKAPVQDGGITNYEIAGSIKKTVKRISLQVDHVNSQITALAEDVGENTSSIASLVLTTEGLTSTVSQQATTIGNLSSTVSGHTQSISTLTQTANSLSSTVSQQGTAIGNLSTSVTQTANSVSSIVQSVGAGGTVTSSSIIQSINNNTSTLKISADKIDIAGAEFPTISNQSTGDDLAEITTLYTRSGGTAKGIKYTAKYHEFNATEDFEVNALDDIELEAVGGTNNRIRLISDGDVTISSGAGSISLSETDGEIRISSTSDSIYLDTTGSTTADIRIYSGDMVYIDAVDDINITSEDKLSLVSDQWSLEYDSSAEEILLHTTYGIKLNNVNHTAPEDIRLYAGDDIYLYAYGGADVENGEDIAGDIRLKGSRIFWNGTDVTDRFE